MARNALHALPRDRCASTMSGLASSSSKSTWFPSPRAAASPLSLAPNVEDSAVRNISVYSSPNVGSNSASSESTKMIPVCAVRQDWTVLRPRSLPLHSCPLQKRLSRSLRPKETFQASSSWQPSLKIAFLPRSSVNGSTEDRKGKWMHTWTINRMGRTK